MTKGSVEKAERLALNEFGDDDNALTEEEISEGWYWCNDCDGLLVNISEQHICQFPDKELANVNIIEF